MAQINRLNPRRVTALTEPGRHADGGNLYLNVTKTGAKSWVFFYRIAGKQREMGLGPAGPGGVSLADAREAAAKARALLAAGIDPLVARKEERTAARVAEARATTFGAYADDFVALHEGEFRNPKHVAQWKMTMGDTYCRDLRKLAVEEIATDDVLAVLKPIWNEKRETANRIRQRIERILDAAKVEGKRSGENPARWKGHLAMLLPAHGKASKGHFRAMPWRAVPNFMAALGEREGIAARALELVVLTAARSGEVRGMTWAEVDLDRAIWTVPASRMKAGREHRVPLSPAAVAVIEAMKPLRPRRAEAVAGALVFPGLRRAPLSDMTLGAVLKRMEAPSTVHGFRSAFRDWAAEATQAPAEVAEMALAHAVGSATVQAYLRSDLFDRRRDLMDRWAAFVTGGGGDVVALRVAK